MLNVKILSENKNLIYFCKPFGRIQADVLDVCHWLIHNNQPKLAEELAERASKSEIDIDKDMEKLKQDLKINL